MNQAIILAAGKSSRTQGIGRGIPKPLLPLDGKPAMEYVVEFLRAAGFDNIIITTHYQAEQIAGYFRDGSRFGVTIRYSYEPQLLDTAGSLRFIYELLDPEFLVCGGHFYLPRLNLQGMVGFHQRKWRMCTIAFCTIENDLIRHFGQAKLDDEQRLIRFQEKPDTALNSLVHTTYQIYRKEIVAMVPPDESLSIPDYLIPELLKRRLPVYGYIVEPPLISISTPELYKRATKLINVYRPRSV